MKPKMLLRHRIEIKRILAASFFTMTTFVAIPLALLADEPIATPPLVSGSAVAAPPDTHYGLFNWLDHRSAYGQGAFPEPFLVDDSDLEVNELRLDWTHIQGHNERSDVMRAEIEKGFGLLTLELEVPYEIGTTTNPKHTTDGFDSINLGARYPIYQFVSNSKMIDSTFGAAFEVGVPSHSSLSHDTEVVPKAFNDLRLGDHITLQFVLGYSKLFGNDADGGLATFEYGFVFGCTIPHEQLPLPKVLQFIPVFELEGETELNKQNPGHNSLTGNTGLRVNLKAVGQVQPRLGVGYVFPIDNGARENTQWGVVTSLVFEY